MAGSFPSPTTASAASVTAGEERTLGDALGLVATLGAAWPAASESPAADCERVLAPGERSHRETLRRQREGIWVEPGTWDKIQQFAAG